MHARVWTVLLVDDSADVRRTVRERYQAIGFVVVGEAENGSTAIALAIEHRPDLIVLDLSMPIMNGLQAAHEIRRLLPTAVIILFTVHGDTKALHATALAAGISCVVAKANIEELIDESEAMLRTYF